VAPPWIFIHDTDTNKVEEGLTALFFGLVFSVAPFPPWKFRNFSVDALGFKFFLYKRKIQKIHSDTQCQELLWTTVTTFKFKLKVQVLLLGYELEAKSV